MAGPFKDDDEKDKRLAKQLESAVKDSKRGREEDEPQDDDVKEFAVGGDDDDDEVAPAKSAEERKTRLEKKKERQSLRESAREADELRAENARLRSEREERTARAAERTEQMTREALGRLSPQREDPLDAEWRTVKAAEESLINEANALQTANQLTPERHKTLRERASQIEEAKQDVLTRRSLARAGVGKAPDAAAIERDVRARGIREEYSDVYADQNAVMYSDGEYSRLRALGHPDSKKTLDMAMHATREQFKLGGASRSREDLDVDRRRFSGQSKAAGGGSGKTVKAMSIKKDSAEWRMAVAYSSHLKNLSDEQKVQRWVNRVGGKG